MRCNLKTTSDGSVDSIEVILDDSTIIFHGKDAEDLMGFCKGVVIERMPVRKTNPEFIRDLIIANGRAKYSKILSAMVKDGRAVSRDSLHTTLNKMIREGNLVIVGSRMPADERTYALQDVDLRKSSLQSKVFDVIKDNGHKMTTKEISDALGLDSTESVKNALRFLKNKGLVSKVGTAGYYGLWEVVA